MHAGEQGIKPDFTQLTPDSIASGDPADLIPELLDKLAALGDLAKQVSLALGNNGHRASALAELKRYLQETK
ncbi:hypothetical protein ES703_89610 [subsurface metagenome]